MQAYEEGEDNIIDMECMLLCLLFWFVIIHNIICLKMITFVYDWLNGYISMYISPCKDVIVYEPSFSVFVCSL